MSGGSFNYLCYADAGELLSRSEDLASMASELRALGYDARDVAERTESLLKLRQHIADEVEALSSVWHAVEWWCSADWSREQVFIAIGEYRERQKRSGTSQEQRW